MESAGDFISHIIRLSLPSDWTLDYMKLVGAIGAQTNKDIAIGK